MKIRNLKHRPRWRLTRHSYGLYNTVHLKRGPFWMVRMVWDRWSRKT